MKANKGFTLIELLVVLAIIGLLSTLAVISLSGARQKSRDAKRVADIKQIQTALELYYNDKSTYPSGSNLALGGAPSIINDCASITPVTAAAPCAKLDTNGFQNASSTATPAYMGSIPLDPTGTAECLVGSTAPCVASYAVAGTPSGTDYRIYFYLEGNTGSLLAGLRTATSSGIQ